MQGNKEQMSKSSKISCKSAEENRNTNQLSGSMPNETFDLPLSGAIGYLTWCQDGYFVRPKSPTKCICSYTAFLLLNCSTEDDEDSLLLIAQIYQLCELKKLKK